MQYGNVLRVSEEIHLEGLNQQQVDAVTSTEGPLLVLAGAGTGKTTVIVSRIAHIISQKLAEQNEVLAVTFTNKSAFEMKQRVARLIDVNVESMWIGTFHSMSARILREHGVHINIVPNFSIIDEEDQTRLVRNIVRVFELDEKQYNIKTIINHIRKWKDRGLLPNQLGLAMGPIETLSRKVYKEYQDRLQTLNALDFGDLIIYSIKLLKDCPEVQAKIHEMFRYILVDEYQDTNAAQYIWLKTFVSKRQNICCVGDDDQAIYSWRGADIGNILRFEKEFENARVIRLEQNYRSNGNILQAAGGLIKNNVKRLGKELWTTRQSGGLLQIKHTWNSEDEARFIGNEIEKLQAVGYSMGSVAVLVRASFQTREFEERFLRQAIPYRVIGGLRFYERQEIKDSIAYIKFLIDNNDSLAFERIINTPKRSIGEATIHKAHLMSQEERISLAEAAQKYAASTRGKASQAITAFFATVNECRRLLESTPPSTVVKTLLENSGYLAMWKQEKSTDSLSRLDNIRELINAISEFDSLSDFVNHVSLMADRIEPDNENLVSIITIHGAKGLEFGTVFLVGWEEGLFPNQRTLVESGVSGLEEERRLAYVAITRAKENVFISYCSHRKTNNAGWQMSMPSRFIRELPKECVIFLDKRGKESVDIFAEVESVRDISEEKPVRSIREKYRFL
ncbi:MAG: UvrD-helicase domain-containing protein [Holosporales bacterium]|jgi:DNA helicase-2/ATP-dependent DNA helicase PcrA|nr:UvrD-helicase domain-containing protein [Holosporales bacterium]